MSLSRFGLVRAAAKKLRFLPADLFRMYSQYAAAHGWKQEVMSSSDTGIGGFKEVIFEVKGKGAFSRLKYESGVHRVQRVPRNRDQWPYPHFHSYCGSNARSG